LSGEMIRDKPEWTWKYLRQIEQACRGATFNRGHSVIAEMEQRFPRVWTLTQNIDGFHRAAGCRNIIAIHGELHRIRCTVCPWNETLGDYAQLPALPRCAKCFAVSRPDVVLFGERLPDAAVRDLIHEVREGFDIVFSIGTTAVFPYIQGPIETAIRRDKPTVEVNPGITCMSNLVRYRLGLGASIALDAIWARLNEIKSSE
jgi:NAD-dependent deacetylase